MSDKVRVLVVDDSAFARKAISKIIDSDSDLQVVGTARDGQDAFEQVKSLKPDVVTLDVTMPNVDGLQALDLIMSEVPTPVVMLSAMTGENTSTTIEALEKGAVDFFLKPSAISPAGRTVEASDLVTKIKTASKISPSRLKVMRKVKSAKSGGLAATNGKLSSSRKKILVIISSTGGPRALAALMPALPENLPAAILIVQHMPPQFTSSLAARLNAACPYSVKEAEEGDRLEYGKALLAPGDYHMLVNGKGEIVLDQGPTVCGVRPAANMTMESVAKVYGNTSLGVILTGMGSDGTDGAKYIKKAGGRIAAEHESSCAVYGMPKSAVEAG
ncbi:MAG: chemotaxis response regulator protein-glutamate methylesterase, partial [Chloroflexi bacterium]|nr:chemotaxis response regulator protein-glutamate methylesterase [Chloroflexota bacterium]